MASQDRGYRSIEVNFMSEVEAQMMVQSAALGNEQSTWVGGEVAGEGIPITPGTPWIFGVCVEAMGATAAASLQIIGHSQPLNVPMVGLAFSNGADDVSTCVFTPIPGLKATVTQENTGDPHHSAFIVLMTGSLGVVLESER